MALLLPLIVLAAFFLFRANPQKRRAQAQKTLVDSLRPGVRVATVSGIIGTLMGVEGDRAALEIAPGVVVEFLLASVTRTIDDEPMHPDGLFVHDENGAGTHDGGYVSLQIGDAGHPDAGHPDAGHQDLGHEDLGHQDAGNVDVPEEDVHHQGANGADAPAPDEHPAPRTKET
jgi:preprotein translocase subunit YajC